MMKKKKYWLIALLTMLLFSLQMNASAAFTVSKSGVSSPTALKVGATFSVRGTLTSSENMAKVVVSIIKGDKQLQRYEAKPNAKRFDLFNADYAMQFNKLSTGEYIYRVSAFNNAGTKFAVVNQKFTVGTVKKITITSPMPSKDFTLTQGGTKTVAGKITSMYKISYVQAKILNSAGSTVQSKKVTPGTKTYNMTTNKTIDNSLLFNKLKPGTYKLQVVVKDVKGNKSTVINRKFTVVAKTVTSTPTTPAPSTGKKADALLATLEKYSNRVKSDAKKGIVWKYNSTYSDQKRTYDEAISNNRRVTTCSWLITWALKDPAVGVLDYYDNFSVVNRDIYFGKGAAQRTRMEKYGKVIKKNGSTTLETLYKNGDLLPGDILLYPDHLNVFVRYDKTTKKGYFYDGGRMGTNGHGTTSNYVFDTFGPVAYSMGAKPIYIYRLTK